MARAKPTSSVSRNTVDPFAALVDEAVPVAAKKPSKKKEREVMKLEPQLAKAFDRFCMSDATLKLAKGNQEAAKALVLPVLTDKLINDWCQEGHRTENPVVQTDNGRAILQARETLKFELPVDEDGTPGTVTELLTNAGFSEAEATAIRQREFSETTELRFGNITKLREDPIAKKVVDKLLNIVLTEFTPEERKLLIEKVNKVEVKEGFLDRAVSHVNRDPVKLKGLLSTIRPQFLMSHIVWNGNLQDAVQQLGTKEGTELPEDTPAIKPAAVKPVVYTSKDGQWKATASNTEASLYMVQGGVEIPMGTRKCTGGADHAKMTCQKWMRDPEYRAESIEKFRA